MQNFQKRIEEIEAAFQTADGELREELRAAEQALAEAQDRLKSQETHYRAALVRGADNAVALRAELDVARDRVAILVETVAQLRADINSGEAVEAKLRKHQAIVGACEAEGAHAIHEAVQAAEAARNAYKAALDRMVEVQHGVASVGRKSHFLTSQLGRPCSPATVGRYNKSEFMVEEPPESQNAASIM